MMTLKNFPLYIIYREVKDETIDLARMTVNQLVSNVEVLIICKQIA